MKSDIDIQDDVFRYLRDNSDFWSEMSAFGFASSSLVLETHKEGMEQIVVSILSGGGDVEEIQESFVNVNVFVNDVKNTEETQGAGEVTTYLTNRNRLRSLCQVLAEYLSSVQGLTYWFTLDAQRVLEDTANHMHFVNNKLLYKSINL